MKRTTMALLTTLLITNGVGISSAMAAPGDDQGRPVPHQQNDYQGQGPQGQERGPQHQDGQNRPQQAGNRDRGQPHRQQVSRFAFHGNDFRRGHPAPESYRGAQYRVDDWRARGLSQPPQGHYWANINGNYVLMAAATGIITSIILNGALSH